MREPDEELERRQHIMVGMALSELAELALRGPVSPTDKFPAAGISLSVSATGVCETRSACARFWIGCVGRYVCEDGDWWSCQRGTCNMVAEIKLDD